jgi:SAM-dependent methyltransferase
MIRLREKLQSLPVAGPALAQFWNNVRARHFNSANYWDERYRRGGNSGDGSYGDLAQFKADVLNHFVATHDIRSVIEFGCGDGNQLRLAQYPKYCGIDISAKAIETCRGLFRQDSSKTFLVGSDQVIPEQAELALSLDVIYHLVEDDVYHGYMQRLFESANRYVIIYSDNEDKPREVPHVRHRKFGSWIEQNRPDWRLRERILNKFPYQPKTQLGSWADFWIYDRTAPRL